MVCATYLSWGVGGRSGGVGGEGRHLGWREKDGEKDVEVEEGG